MPGLAEWKITSVDFKGTFIPPEEMRRNVEANLRIGLPEEIPKTAGPVHVACGGPSLAGHLADLRHPRLVIALNGAWNFLRGHGITPWAHMITDSRPENAAFVRDPDHDALYLIGSRVHPSVLERLEGFDVRLIHHFGEIEVGMGLKETKTLISSGVSVGTMAFCLACYMGFEKIHFYGMDSCILGGDHHAYPQEWQAPNGAHPILAGHREFLCEPWMLSQALDFKKFLLGPEGWRAEVHGPGLIAHMQGLMREAYAAGESPDLERMKYEEIWAVPGYGDYSPGKNAAPEAVGTLGMMAGDTILDFGCGSGKGAIALHDMGMAVTMVDITPKGLSLEVTDRWPLPFVEACLWELPASLGSVDWGFCADVMEHIPPARVDDVLGAIRAKTRKGSYFQVCICPDGDFGRRIGKTLHLSAHQPDWWEAALGRHWPLVMRLEDPGPGRCAFTCMVD